MKEKSESQEGVEVEWINIPLGRAQKPIAAEEQSLSKRESANR